MVAHELNHHSASITQILDFLKYDDLSDDKRRTMVGNLVAVNNKLSITVENMNKQSYKEHEERVNSDFINSDVIELKSVLLVDDDSITNAMNKMVIEKMIPSIDLITVLHGETALEVLHGESLKEIDPDFIILDINMPIMNGWEFLEILHEKGNTIDVHMLTSSQDPIEEETALAYPFVKSFNSKPLDFNKFRRIAGTSGFVLDEYKKNRGV